MDFFFENPIIMIILIGIISSFFKKTKNETKPNPKQPKPFIESLPKRVSEVLQEFELSPDESPKKLQTGYEEAKKQADMKIASLEEQQMKYMEKVEQLEIEKEKSLRNALKLDEQADTVNTLAVDKEKLVDAIIWSEILGPPRAKKPHRSMNTR